MVSEQYGHSERQVLNINPIGKAAEPDITVRSCVAILLRSEGGNSEK